MSAGKIEPFNPTMLQRDNKSFRSIFDNFMNFVAFACGAISVIPLLAVLLFVSFKGLSRVNLTLFTALPPQAGLKGGGIGIAIVGTIITVALGAIISIPFGVLASIYLNEFGKGTIPKIVRFCTNVLSGVPSIMAGVFAYGVVVLTIGRPSAFAAGVALAVLMLPTIVRTTDEALKLVPDELRQAAVGLGATRFQTVWQIIIPYATPAIVTGVTLAIARAAGETAPLLFATQFSFQSPQLAQLAAPDALFGLPMATLAYLVYEFARGFDQNQQELAWAASLILVLMVLITSIITRFVTKQKRA